MRRSSWLAALVFLLLSPTGLAAQRRSDLGSPALPETRVVATDRFRPVAEPGDSVGRRGGRPVLLLAGAGVAAGAAGWLAGARLGGRECGRPPCGAAGLLGAYAAESGALASAVHLANGRRGSWIADVVTAVAAPIFAGLALSAVLPDDSGAADTALLVALPVVQVASTIAIERATSPDR